MLLSLVNGTSVMLALAKWDEFYLDQTFTNVAHAKELQKMQLIYTMK